MPLESAVAVIFEAPPTIVICALGRVAPVRLMKEADVDEGGGMTVGGRDVDRYIYRCGGNGCSKIVGGFCGK